MHDVNKMWLSLSCIFTNHTRLFRIWEHTIYFFWGGMLPVACFHCLGCDCRIPLAAGNCNVLTFWGPESVQTVNCNLLLEEEVTNLQWAKKDVHLVLTKRICTAESICNTIIQASCLVNNWAKSTNSIQQISGKNVYTNMSLIQTCKDNFHFCCILSVLYFEACPWSLHFNAASMQQQYTQIFELIGEKQNMFGLLSVMQFHSF